MILIQNSSIILTLKIADVGIFRNELSSRSRRLAGEEFATIAYKFDG